MKRLFNIVFLIIVFISGYQLLIDDCIGAEKELAGYWNFDKIERGIVVDQSPNGLDAQLQGDVEIVKGIKRGGDTENAKKNAEN